MCRDVEHMGRMNTTSNYLQLFPRPRTYIFMCYAITCRQVTKSDFAISLDQSIEVGVGYRASVSGFLADDRLYDALIGKYI